MSMHRTWCMSMPELATKGLSATVARASVLSPESGQCPASQAQLLLQLLNVRQVRQCIPLDAHCTSEDSCLTCLHRQIESDHVESTVRICHTIVCPSNYSRGGGLASYIAATVSSAHFCMCIQVFPDAAGPLGSRPCISLAALYVAGLATSMHRDAVWAHVAMRFGDAALQQMSDALPTVLQMSTLQGIAPLIVQSLHALYAHPTCDPYLQKLTLHCCLTVHDDMNAAGIRKLSVVATRTLQSAER